MRKSLIFCTVGQSLPSDGPYAENHWRRTDRGNREYETAIVNYNYESDFKPEEYSYDFIENKKGYKWPLSHEYLIKHRVWLMENYE
jgi:hypothetical protein